MRDRLGRPGPGRPAGRQADMPGLAGVITASEAEHTRPAGRGLSELRKSRLIITGGDVQPQPSLLSVRLDRLEPAVKQLPHFHTRLPPPRPVLLRFRIALHHSYLNHL